MQYDDKVIEAGSNSQDHNMYKCCWQHHCNITALMTEYYKTPCFTEWCQSMANYHHYMANYQSMQCQNCSPVTQLSAWRNNLQHVDVDSMFNKQHKRNKAAAARRKRRRRSRAMNNNGSSVEFHIANIDTSGGDLDIEASGEHVEFEFEMTKELEEFFAQTAKHRQQREILKVTQAATSNQDTLEYVDVSSLSAGQSRPTVLPPSEQIGSRRLMEMKQLYGSGAAMIHGMETAMQLTFDRNIDKFKPRLWPAVPLNIVYH
jgi:gem associated protein 8